MTRTDIIHRMAEANHQLCKVEMHLPTNQPPSLGQLNEIRFQEAILAGLCRDLFMLVDNPKNDISMNE